MSKQLRNIILVIVFVLAAVFVLRFVIGGDEDNWLCENNQWVKHGNPTAAMPATGCGPVIDNFDDCVAAGNIVMEIYPEQCRTADGRTFTKNIGNELEKTDLIQVDNPRPNASVASPLEISGRARGSWFFEGDFPITITDANGKELGTAIAQAQSNGSAGSPQGWMTEEFVPFTAQLDFAVPVSDQGTLTLEKNNPSGLTANNDQLIIPVKFDLTETTKIQVYFDNNQQNPAVDCSKVFPVERKIWKTPAVARAALVELLKGPTETEKEQGFKTTLPQGVEIKSLTIENGVAKADFNNQLQFQVGGACLVTFIRSQITETLKQFPTVESVVISVDGQTEDILQP